MAHAMNALGQAGAVQLTYRPTNGGTSVTVKVNLRATPYLASNGLFPSLDLQAQTLSRSVLPFKVSVDAGDIGGPSAGLAFTLAILDTLTNGRLTGGHRVAATGTINPSGDVGDVGGVREKTAAVQAAGAQVFFVPKVEYGNARAAAKPGLTIVPVTTLRQVLDVLRSKFGGDLSGVNLKG
jgi:PDZ domain-containing secreted protein